MASELLVNGAKTLFRHLKQDGMPVERMLFLPAYDGMVEGLFILVVIIPGVESHFEKTESIIQALHEYVPIDQRRGITGVQVYKSLTNFYRAIDLKNLAIDDENSWGNRFQIKPELIPIAA